MIDLVFVSNALDDTRKFLTESAITLARSSDDLVDRIIVVEQQHHIAYPETTVHYDFDFNYHKCLNLGIEWTEAEYIGLCNNDIKFHLGWAEKLIDGMGDCLSASPYSANVHDNTEYPAGSGNYGRNLTYDPVGYDARAIIAGWCIVIHRSVLEKIGKLHEGVAFWYSDNLYAEQIKKAGIDHKLIRASRVEHLETRTLSGHPRLDEYTGGQKADYIKAYNEIWK